MVLEKRWNGEPGVCREVLGKMPCALSPFQKLNNVDYNYTTNESAINGRDGSFPVTVETVCLVHFLFVVIVVVGACGAFFLFLFDLMLLLTA